MPDATAFLLILIIILVLASLSKSKQQYGYTYQTLYGETVKSKSKKQLSDYFISQNIHYLYEKEARQKGILSRRITNQTSIFPIMTYTLNIGALLMQRTRMLERSTLKL